MAELRGVVGGCLLMKLLGQNMRRAGGHAYRRRQTDDDISWDYIVVTA